MNINFSKSDGLIPVIIQHDETLQVLMLGYMNEAAFAKTKAEGIVTFFSRSKNRLWTKGETSGNKLLVKKIQLDCDADTLLIQAIPAGPVCHTGQFSCFEEKVNKGFVYELEQIISSRKNAHPDTSYTSSLFQSGTKKIAQKVGEEATELVLEAMDNQSELFMNEAADLLFHYLVLLQQKGTNLSQVERYLMERHNNLSKDHENNNL